MRKILFAIAVSVALALHAQIAAARQTVGTISVNADVIATCLVDLTSKTLPVHCNKGISFVMTTARLTPADVGTLLALAGTSPIGLGDPPSSWTLISINL